MMSLAAGISLPIMQLERLYFFSDRPSILSLIAGLWREGDRTLAILVFVFSVAFPLMKTGILCLRELAGSFQLRVLDRALPHLSKWSMVDVMLVAIAIFAAKTSGLASIAVLPGLWLYACSAIVTGILLNGAFLESKASSPQNPRN